MEDLFGFLWEHSFALVVEYSKGSQTTQTCGLSELIQKLQRYQEWRIQVIDFIYPFTDDTINIQRNYYFWDRSLTENWPTHDPCGLNRANHKSGVSNPGGAIYIRWTLSKKQNVLLSTNNDNLEMLTEKIDYFWWYPFKPYFMDYMIPNKRIKEVILSLKNASIQLLLLENSITGWVRLIRSLSSATFSFELCGFSN